jgi:glutamine amidotransferase
MSSKVIIVDYGTGNLHSVTRSLNRLGVRASVTSCPEDIASSDKIILPGVGHFGKTMSRLSRLGFVDVLNEAVMVRGKPILGICLGMELMAKGCEEGDSDGLGWFDAKAIRFRISDRIKYKIPHIGWNQIRIQKSSRLMKDIPNFTEFYFLHSYHFITDDQEIVLSETEYGSIFPSAVEKDNIFGVQFHPEKSHDAGAQLLRNFIEL